MTANISPPPVHLADSGHIGTLLVDKLIVTSGGGGPVVGLTPPFVYTATGAEPPGGFNVAFAARGGAPYVAIVQYESGAVDFMNVAAPPASYADDHIVVKTSGQLQAGDKIAVHINDV